ncbi:MAG: hypothetical protein HFJ45_08055 [Clostridia bacterium]|nr:hypothetical protein [Clostridia bacterium]
MRPDDNLYTSAGHIGGFYGIARDSQKCSTCGNTIRHRADEGTLNQHTPEYVFEAAKYCLQYDSTNFKCIKNIRRFRF